MALYDRAPLSNGFVVPSPSTTSRSITIANFDTKLQNSFFQNDDEILGPDRLKSCIPYTLPLLDGDMFGKYIYQHIPPIDVLHELLLAPLVAQLTIYPFFTLIFFVLLSVGSRSPSLNLSRNVRFNAQQAVLIDILLIIPVLISEALDGTGVVPRLVEEMGCNFVWYAYVSMVVYACVCNLRGKKPDGIPYISPTADYIVGPM